MKLLHALQIDSTVSMKNCMRLHFSR